MEELLYGPLHYVITLTGRIVVWLVSLGKWRGERWLGEEGRIHGAAGALSFVRDGTRIITDTGLFLFGLAFYAALLTATLLLVTYF